MTRPVFGKFYKREPWRWDLSTSVIVNKFLNIRYKLIPYIYTEAYKYHKYGNPLIDNAIADTKKLDIIDIIMYLLILLYMNIIMYLNNMNLLGMKTIY